MKKYRISIHKNEIKEKIKGKWIDVPEFVQFETDDAGWIQVERKKTIHHTSKQENTK